MGANCNIQSVLFICSYNAVRSVMAEALLKNKLTKSLYVKSAGVYSGADNDVFVSTVLKEIDVDIAAHIPTSFHQLDEGGFDLIIALSKEAHEFAIKETRTESVDIEFWPTYDATTTMGSRDGRMDAYREVRDQIDAKIKDRFAKWMKI